MIGIKRKTKIQGKNMIKFNSLWANFPDKDKVKKLCTNKQSDSNNPFDNYCAILLSECFIQSGIDTSGMTGAKCWSHSGKKHILRAEELAVAISNRNIPGFSKVTKVSPANFQEKLKNKTGVVFFKDYWQRGNEKYARRSGDHIDLWNKNEISGQGMFMRTLYEFFGVVSDLNRSREVWFWEVK